MQSQDPHLHSANLNAETSQRLINRLENRAKDKVFTDPFDQYASEFKLTDRSVTVEMGCGTGAMLRRLAAVHGAKGRLIGLDQSQQFINAANEFAQIEGHQDRFEFAVCNCQNVPMKDNSADVVFAHTLISHIAEPEALLREMVRIVKPTGTIVIFDGDYSSLTFAMPDHDAGQRMDQALIYNSFHNPLVMRDMIAWLPELKLELKHYFPVIVSEIGKGSYFKSFADTFAPLVAEAGLLSQTEVDQWFSVQMTAMEDSSFFASCNYYTYVFAPSN